MTGIQKLFTTMAVSALVVVLLFSTPTIARAQTITNMTAGGTISLATVIDNSLQVQVGDKLFGNFFFSYLDTDGISSDDLTRSNVTLSTIANVIGFGLQFQQPLLAVGPVIKDIVIEYTAAVTNPTNFISDIHLSITGSAGNGGLGTVGENVFNNGFGGTSVGLLQASIPVSSNDVASANIVPPVAKLWVEKDVIVTGNSAANGFASITLINQTFSQVPEPSTVLLVGLGLLGLVAVKRKRKS
jgi:PEP-CTERM motif